jgi:cytidyltransferase-like protein
MQNTRQVVVSGSFDDLRSRHLRFLEEAAKLGDLNVLLWSDEAVGAVTGQPPKFQLSERQYLLASARYVKKVFISDSNLDQESLPVIAGLKPEIWVVDGESHAQEKETCCRAGGVEYRVLAAENLSGFPTPPPQEPSGRKKVVATGCYDWFHSGHVRFCEEVSGLGDLYVVVGHDENIRLLKGEGHPLFPQEERRYVVGSVRYVTQALISSGTGWMDAEPEIARIQPDMYAVNEDGDVLEKREFCKKHGLEYVVLKRTPKEGLARRSSTNLRGF